MRPRTLGPLVLLAGLLVAASAAVAGTAASPEIDDPASDGVHYEFRHREPSLDLTKAWFTWSDGTLHVHLLVDAVETFGADGTRDETDAGTRYDVYWTMDGEEYVARAATCTPRPAAACSVPSDGSPVYLAGQSMRIERKMFWDGDRDIHGDLQEQSGGLAETGEPGHVRIDVDPAAVGNPGPGSVLEDPAFSTYVDHHNPGSGSNDGPNHHHPGHVDANDEAGADFRIPGDASPAGGDGPADPTAAKADAAEASGDADTRLLLAAGIFLAAIVLTGRASNDGPGT